MEGPAGGVQAVSSLLTLVKRTGDWAGSARGAWTFREKLLPPNPSPILRKLRMRGRPRLGMSGTPDSWAFVGPLLQHRY